MWSKWRWVKRAVACSGAPDGTRFLQEHIAQRPETRAEVEDQGLVPLDVDQEA